MSEQDKLGVVNEIIEGFEDFLNDRGIDVPNEDKAQSEAPSTIYGTDYGELQDAIFAILENSWFPTNNDELLEYASEFIEAFEDFLDDRGIEIPNDEKLEDPDASTIYGSDYGELENVVMDTLDAYGVIDLEKIRNNQFFNPSGEGDPGSDNVLIRLPEPEEPKKEIEKPIIENGETITANEFLRRLKEQHDENQKRDSRIPKSPEKER